MFSYFTSARSLFCSLFCVALLGCQAAEEERPANMVPETKLVRILADVHTAEALIERQVAFPDTALMTFNAEQEQILKKYGVTQAQFRSTYKYYLAHVDEMDKLYETIIDTLALRESKAKAAAGITDDSTAVEPRFQPAPLQ